MFFSWVTPLVTRGYKQQLQFEDLLPLTPDVSPGSCTARLWLHWSQEKSGRQKPSLLRAIIAAFGAPYFSLAILKAANDALTFAGPILLNLMARYLDHNDSRTSNGSIGSLNPQHQSRSSLTNGSITSYHAPSSPMLGDSHATAAVHDARSLWHIMLESWSMDGPYFGYWCALLLGVTALLKAVLNSHYSYQLSKVVCRLRVALMGCLYKTALLSRASDATADAQTLMGVDTGRAVNLCLSFHELWSLPIQIAVAMYLLYTQVRYAFVAGVVVCVSLIPINRWLAQRIQAASQEMMGYKDARVRVMGECLKGMRGIKMMAWETVFVDKVAACRRGELRGLAVRKYLDALCVYFWAATQLLFSVLTFGLVVLLGQSLRPSIVFTSLALFGILIAPLNALPWVINGMVEALVSLRRLQQYLVVAARHADWAQPAALQPPGHAAEDTDYCDRGVAIQLCKATYRWRLSDKPCLVDISLAIPEGRLTAVVGEVGSGKTSLLHALMGELDCLGGKTLRSRNLRQYQGLAYVGQAPWVMAGTVRDNITLGKPYDPEFMQEVLHACALDADVAALPAGDLTRVGDRGMKLSGGQRVRLALCRALYQQCPLYLLDDILSAVDNHVAQWLITHALLGYPMRDATVVLVTKSATCVQAAALVVSLHHHRVGYVGSSEGYAHWRVTQVANDGLRHHQYHRHHRDGEGCLADDDGDVDPCALSVVMGQGMWHNHASQIPQLAAIQEEAASATAVLGSMQAVGSADDDDAVGKGPNGSSLIDRDADGPLPVLTGTGKDIQDEQFHTAPGQSKRASEGPSSGGSAMPADWPGSDPDMPTEHVDFCKDGEDAQEQREVGHVKWPVYVSYMRAVGWCMVVAVLSSLILMQASKNANDLWVSYWVSSNNPPATPNMTLVSHSHGSAAMAEAPSVLISLCQGPVLAARPSVAADTAGACMQACGAQWVTRVGGGEGMLVMPGSNYNDDDDTAALQGSATMLHRLWGAGGSLCKKHIPNDNTLHTPNQHLKQRPRGRVTRPAAVRRMLSLQHNLNAAKDQQIPPPPTLSLASVYGYRMLPIDPSMQPFLKGLLAIAITNTVFTLARAFTFAIAGMTAAKTMHESLLSAVLGAPMSFFETNPAGRILNRFSSDVSTVDDSLPFIMNILLANMVSLVGVLAVLCYSQPLLLVAVLLLGALYSSLQVFYRATSRELRRLDALSLSPLYSSFGEAVEGAASIRAYAAQKTFVKNFISLLNSNQKAAMSSAAASNWLSARLQALAAALAAAVASLAAAAHNAQTSGQPSWLGNVSVGLLGLSLAYCLPIVGLLNGLLASSAETEQEMVAVERVQQYIQGCQQEEAAQEACDSTQKYTQQPKGQQPRQQYHEHNQASALQPYHGNHDDLMSPLLPGDDQEHVIMMHSHKSMTSSDNTAVSSSASRQTANEAGVAVEFTNVYMRYRPAMPWALEGVSFQVMAGQHVGVCGRTGAGKSSVLSVLLRLTPIQHGTITVWGQDTNSMPLRTLRSTFGVVPQAPLLFTGSIRSNLDPWGQYSHHAVASALQSVHLWEHLTKAALQRSFLTHEDYLMTRRVSADTRPYHMEGRHAAAATAPSPKAVSVVADKQLNGSSSSSSVVDPSALGSGSSSVMCRPLPGELLGTVLSMQVGGDTGMELSSGQQQLLCLARMLLRKNRIVLLDECTASVDHRTAQLMKDVLSHTLGPETTVVQIAHDLNAIVDYDQVLVMAEGQVIERGVPAELAKAADSHFAQLLSRAH